MSTDTNYPGAIDDATPVAFEGNFDEASWLSSGQGTRLMKAVIKIQTILGVNPHGSVADVATRLSLLSLKPTVAGTVVASATQTQIGATVLVAELNRVVTVTTAGDAVKIPAATVNRTVKVINANVTNALGIFPSSGDAINAIAVDGVYSLAATKTVEFNCAVAGIWNTNLSA